jgi:hypothetical protein
MPLPITFGAASARGFGLFSAPATVLDPFFPYVTMLLHGDGTNGAQNNTFLDSSTNNFSITRNGNTTQGSFSPYGNNWSNYFNGAAEPNTDRLRITNTSALNLGSGDFTVECWWFSSKALNTYTLEYAQLLGKGSNQAGSWNLSVYQNKIYWANSAGAVTIQGSINVTANTWYHFAVTRSGGTIRVFVNGILDGSATSSQDITSSQTFAIGDRQPSDGSGQYPFNGYISNVRVVVGTAVYTSAFTPSTTPLTAIANTSLLTCQSNRFIDNSTNAFTITVAGNPSVQRFSPFSPSAAYSTSVIGGSGYFDGTGDFLTCPNSGALTLGSGNWTIEAWVYLTSTSPSYQGIIDWRSGSNAGQPELGLAGATFTWYMSNTGNMVQSSSLNINTWYHVAVCKSGSSTKMFVNGVQAGSTYTDTNTYSSANPIRIGNTFDNFYLNGYVTDARVVVGSALYTSNFTPPTAPLTAITNTSLLTNFTNGAIFDNAMMNNLETVGNAQISTSVVKYGSGSMAFDGSGDYLLGPNFLNGDFGTGDFTVEYWFNCGTQGISYSTQVGTLSSATIANTWRFGTQLGVSAGLYFSYYNGATFSDITFTTTNYNNNTWYHAALTRSSGTVRAFINGTQVGSNQTVTQNLSSGSKIIVGAELFTPSYYNGYIDDLRITKGYARYTTNFTPPTQAFQNN